MTNSPFIEDEIVDMAALLDSGGAPEPRSLRRGEVVEGVVMGTERDGVLVFSKKKLDRFPTEQEVERMGRS